MPRNRGVRPERRCRSVGVREDAREETRARRRGGRCRRRRSVFGFDESNVVLFVGVRANASDIDSTWPHVFGVSGAEALVGSNTFQDASLFEVVTCSKRDETEHRFTHIVRVSLGPIGDDEALVRAAEDAVKRACATLDSDAFVSSYACVFNIGKSGTPPRKRCPPCAKMAKKKKEAEALRA